MSSGLHLHLQALSFLSTSIPAGADTASEDRRRRETSNMLPNPLDVHTNSQSRSSGRRRNRASALELTLLKDLA